MPTRERYGRVTNGELAARLGDLADYMALDGSDPHRVSHYRGAATAIRRFEHSIAEMIRAGIDLTEVPGIGKGLAGFLEELVEDGTSRVLDEYETRVPAGLLSVVRLDGVGPTRARTLWKDGGVASVADLEMALAARTLHRLDGFGPATASRIAGGLAARAALEGRSLLSVADRAAEALLGALAGAGLPARTAGELARRTETVEFIDLVVGSSPDRLWDVFTDRPDMTVSSPRGTNPVEGLAAGVKVRLVAALPDMVGAVTHHLTGPAEYLEALGDQARSDGLELTPTGLATATSSLTGVEEEMYRTLGLPWIPPELRSGPATLERISGGAPDLVGHDQVQGDFHMHTTWSDGAASLERMVAAAAQRGYAYIAITDHSPSTGPTGGLDGDALRRQAAEIARVQERFDDIRILRGCEVDILPDGSLDLSDDVLAELDVVLVSVHSGFETTESRMTERIITALRNPWVHVLCHPTGRKLGRRPGFPVDLDAVLDAARDLGVAIEVNGNPRRLDLSHDGLWQCREVGVNVVVSSDAHSVARLDNVRYAVDQARRGWLEKEHIVNTGTLDDVLRWIGRRAG